MFWNVDKMPAYYLSHSEVSGQDRRGEHTQAGRVQEYMVYFCGCDSSRVLGRIPAVSRDIISAFLHLEVFISLR